MVSRRGLARFAVGMDPVARWPCDLGGLSGSRIEEGVLAEIELERVSTNREGSWPEKRAGDFSKDLQ